MGDSLHDLLPSIAALVFSLLLLFLIIAANNDVVSAVLTGVVFAADETRSAENEGLGPGLLKGGRDEGRTVGARHLEEVLAGLQKKKIKKRALGRRS